MNGSDFNNLVNSATINSNTITAAMLKSGIISSTKCAGTFFLDEDDMASNSATAVASQQSIVSYLASVANNPGYAAAHRYASNKNAIAGGDFSINPWGRGSTFTSVSDSTETAPRWHVVKKTTGSALTVQKTADAPSDTQTTENYRATHCLEALVTTADTGTAAGDLHGLEYRMPGYDYSSMLAGSAAYLSFWVKCSDTGTFGIAMSNDSADESLVNTFNVTATATWEKKTISIAAFGDTGGWDYSTGVGLRVRFALMGGSTYQDTGGSWTAGDYWTTSAQTNLVTDTGNYLRIAMVQLQHGSDSAAPFYREDSNLVEHRLTNGSYVEATGSSDTQTLSTGVDTKVQLNSEVVDYQGEYDDTGNYRFTPTQEGYYFVGARILWQSGSSSLLRVMIFKNGSNVHSGANEFITTASSITLTTFSVVYCNGTTDYLEIYANTNTANRDITPSGCYVTYAKI